MRARTRVTACFLLLTAVALAQEGRELFSSKCAVCHGDGHGTERGPNLANSRRVRSRSVPELQTVIRDGVPAAGMPAFNLPEAELKSVTAFVRSFSAPALEAGAPGNRAAGERFFFGKGGRPVLLPGAEPTREGTKACPSVLGGTNWMSTAFNPSTRLFYVMALEACGIYVKPPGWNPKIIPLDPEQKFLRAIDIETGKRVWEAPQIGPADSWGGVLSTAGGVVFFGEDSGAFASVDAKTGKDLWQIQTNASTELGDGHSWRASPMTFLAGGKQYIAVAAGPNILCFGLP